MNLEFITDKIAARHLLVRQRHAGRKLGAHLRYDGVCGQDRQRRTEPAVRNELCHQGGTDDGRGVSAFARCLHLRCDPARGAGRCDRLHVDLAGLCRSRCDGWRSTTPSNSKTTSGRPLRVLQRRRYGFADSGLQISLLILCRERNGLRHAIPHRQQEDFGDVDARRRIVTVA